MRTTQNQQILQCLNRRKGKWVGLPTLARESGSLSPATRISNLRKAGYEIENKTAKVKRNGRFVTTSCYRIHV